MTTMLNHLPDMKTCAAVLGRLFHRHAQACEARQEERDMTVITATLMRLSERQLNRIGMSRRTLALDVDDLATRADQERQICREVMEIVKGGESRRAIADD